MKHCFVAAAAFFSCAASLAANVTIDFEALPDQTGLGCGPVCTSDPAQWIDKGFVIAGSDSVANGSFAGGVVSPGIGFAPDPSDFGMRSLLICGTCGPFELVLTQQNGQAFNLLSFDLTSAFPGGGDEWTITGAIAGGGDLVTTITTGADITAAFDATWVNLDSVTILAAADGALDYRLDNIVVTAVPIPAAVWLFSSALAGLGFVSQRKKAP